MKITDWNEVELAARSYIAEYGAQLTDYVTEEDEVRIMTIIYLTNDVNQAVGQNFPNKFSVVSSRQRISVIYDVASSSYKASEQICGYDYILDDMESISVVLGAALERMQHNAA